MTHVQILDQNFQFSPTQTFSPRYCFKPSGHYEINAIPIVGRLFTTAFKQILFATAVPLPKAMINGTVYEETLGIRIEDAVVI
jgi:hypothetical protein